ncbi:hypothetical protein D3C85_1129760 [compost metagenome]
MSFKNIIHGSGSLPSFLDMKSRIQALNTQMIFFVDHNAQTFIFTDENRAIARFGSKIRADQMFLNENSSVQIIHLIQEQEMQHSVLTQAFVFKDGFEPCQHFFRLLVRRQHGKSKMLKVPRNPYPAADDNIGFISSISHPFTERLFCKPEIRHNAFLLL